MAARGAGAAAGDAGDRVSQHRRAPAHLLAVFKQSLAEAGQEALRAIGGASLRLN